MKTIIKDTTKRLVADRPLLAVLGLLILLTIGLVIYVGLSVNPSELQLVSRYSAFGITHLYREQWFYLLSFAVFGVMAATLHTIITAKILALKGHSLAIMFAWLGVAIVLLAFATSRAVINVWSPL